MHLMLKKIILLFTFLGTIVFFVKLYYQEEAQTQKINNIADQIKLSFDSNLKQDELDDLKVALLLAKNKGLVDALENDDEDLAFELLSGITQSIKKNTNISIRAQIITKELNILARSWDDIYMGMPLGDYRDDLDYFKSHTTPRSSIEIGRRLGIKATVPIYKKKVLLGFVEVISFFQNTTEFLSSIGVDLYVLLDIKDAEKAVLMTNNLTIGDYIVSNINYNYNHIQTLKHIDFQTLKLNKIIQEDHKYIFSTLMYQGNYEAIGKFIFVLPQRYVEYFRNPEDDISYLINVTRSALYDVVKKKQYKGSVYDAFQVDKLVYFKDSITKNDKQEFLDETYKKLSKFDKDELIQMMLGENVVKKIDGEIR